jgi:hypothetical protein
MIKRHTVDVWKCKYMYNNQWECDNVRPHFKGCWWGLTRNENATTFYTMYKWKCDLWWWENAMILYKDVSFQCENKMILYKFKMRLFYVWCWDAIFQNV